jgi:ABC-type dipeptide/oligopeptide/nickel transport system permease subunit
MARWAFAVMCVYGLIALADSVGWADNKNAPRKTVIDRIFERPQERTYSAPLATRTTASRGRGRCSTAGTCWAPTGPGNDVLYMTLKGCRTAIIIGGLTSLIVTPLALFLSA